MEEGGETMVDRKDLIIIALCGFILAVTLYPTIQASWPYDPWCDNNFDGKIRVDDILNVALRFGTDGTAINETGATGGGQAHENMHPYLGLRAIIALSGVYPSTSGEPVAGPYIGEIRWVAFPFAPGGWAACDGQLLAISAAPMLYSLLGTMYGGDGITTFALPDLRGRSPLHEGKGPGLTHRALGQKGGVETVTLTTNEMPSHTHPITPVP